MGQSPGGDNFNVYIASGECRDGACVTIRWADGGDTGLMIMITLRTDDGMTR